MNPRPRTLSGPDHRDTSSQPHSRQPQGGQGQPGEKKYIKIDKRRDKELFDKLTDAWKNRREYPGDVLKKIKLSNKDSPPYDAKVYCYNEAANGKAKMVTYGTFETAAKGEGLSWTGNLRTSVTMDELKPQTSKPSGAPSEGSKLRQRISGFKEKAAVPGWLGSQNPPDGNKAKPQSRAPRFFSKFMGRS